MATIGGSLDETLELNNLDATLINHEEVQKCVIRLCDNMADIIANTATISQTIPSIKESVKKGISEFSSKFSELNSSDLDLGEYGNYSVSIPSSISGENIKLDDLEMSDELLSSMKNFSNDVLECSVYVLSGIQQFREKILPYVYANPIDEFGRARLTEADLENGFLDYFGLSSESLIAYAGGILQEALSNTKASGLGLLIGYGTDALDGADGIVGNGAAYLAKKGYELIKPGLPPIEWVNTLVGTGAVIAWTAYKDWAEDKGEWTGLDTTRTIVDCAKAGTIFWVSSAVGGAIGGPLGAAAAVMVAVPLDYMFNAARDIIVGDNIIDTIYYSVVTDKNGNIIDYIIHDEPNPDSYVYEVPRNGNGKDGTFDVIRESYRDTYNETIYSSKYGVISIGDYKDMMYADWTDPVLAYGNRYDGIDEDAEAAFNSLLEEFTSQEITSKEEADEWFEQRLSFGNEYYGSDAWVAYEELMQQSLFDVWEYYKYKTTGSWR